MARSCIQCLYDLVSGPQVQVALPKRDDKESWLGLGRLLLSIGYFDVAERFKDINLRCDHSRNTQLDGSKGNVVEGENRPEGNRCTYSTRRRLKSYTHIRIAQYSTCNGLQRKHIHITSAYLHKHKSGTLLRLRMQLTKAFMG